MRRLLVGFTRYRQPGLDAVYAMEGHHLEVGCVGKREPAERLRDKFGVAGHYGLRDGIAPGVGDLHVQRLVPRMLYSGLNVEPVRGFDQSDAYDSESVVFVMDCHVTDCVVPLTVSSSTVTYMRI